MQKIKTIGVITTGGDAPGMNTAIRAVVRTAIFHGLKVFGVERGWMGLIENDMRQMDIASVGGILNRGGTILHTVRCPRFKEKKSRDQAFKNLKSRGIDALVVIGGDGSLMAAEVFGRENNLPIINIPASIDNDIPGTDYTIGFDTAVNTAVEAIDKIRDTATSHERLFVIEVMGRGSGSIAIDVGLVCGAEFVIVPEFKYDINKMCKLIRSGRARGKKSFIIVVAEGAASGHDIAKQIKKCIPGVDARVSVLGHIQRGGAPTALSRELACKMGSQAVGHLLAGKSNGMLGVRSEKIVFTSYKELSRMKKKIDLEAYRIAKELAI